MPTTPTPSQGDALIAEGAAIAKTSSSKFNKWVIAALSLVVALQFATLAAVAADPDPTPTPPPVTAPPTSSTTTTLPPTVTSLPPTSTSTLPPNPPAAFPGPTNTGPSGTLAVRQGDLTVTTPGQVVENVDVRGRIYVNAANVTVRNFRATNGITAIEGGATITDFDVGPTSGRAEGEAVIVAKATVRRGSIHNFPDGIRTLGGNTIVDNWLHDFSIGAGDHNDGIQFYCPGCNNGTETVRHNTIDCKGCTNAAIFYADNWRGSLVLDNNLLSGAGFTIKVHESGSAAITNNEVVKGSYTYGPVNFACTNRGSTAGCSSLGKIPTYSGNKLSDGTPI